MNNLALRNLFDGQLPRAVLFDLDGTLVDSVPDLALAIDLALHDASLPAPGVNRVRDWVGNGAQVLVRRAVKFSCELMASQASPHSLAGEMNNLEGEELEQLEQFSYQRFLYHYGHLPANDVRSELYDGVVQLLSTLQKQGVLIALVTNKPSQFTPTILQKFSIQTYFDVLVCGDTLDEKKPSSKPLLFAAQQLAVSVDQCLMIGDSKNDIQAAQHCEMKCVSVAWGYNYSESVAALAADLHIQNFSELL